MNGPWEWWAGYGPEVDDEHIYTIACCATRDEAIAAGKKAMPDPDGATYFYIIEAIVSDDADPSDEFQPFIETRNEEKIETNEEIA